MNTEDIEAAICFAEHSKWTHENWAEWLGGGGHALPEAGGLEHHQECIQEYEHIITVLRTKEALLAQVARLESELAELKKSGKILVRDNDRAYAANAALTAALRELRDLLPEYTEETEEGVRLNIAATLDAALSDTGEGKSKACPSCGCVLGTNTHCGTCKLNRGGGGWLRGLPFAALVSAWVKAQPEMMAGIREGVKAVKEGRVTPWEDVERELGLGGCDICGIPWAEHEAPPYECEAKRRKGWLEVREQARLAIGHAFHLIEHNKAMCVRCREAKQRLRAALDALGEK